MADETIAHNLIAGNLYTALRGRYSRCMKGVAPMRLYAKGR